MVYPFPLTIHRSFSSVLYLGQFTKISSSISSTESKLISPTMLKLTLLTLSSTVVPVTAVLGGGRRLVRGARDSGATAAAGQASRASVSAVEVDSHGEITDINEDLSVDPIVEESVIEREPSRQRHVLRGMRGAGTPVPESLVEIEEEAPSMIRRSGGRLMRNRRGVSSEAKIPSEEPTLAASPEVNADSPVVVGGSARSGLLRSKRVAIETNYDGTMREYDDSSL